MAALLLVEHQSRSFKHPEVLHYGAAVERFEPSADVSGRQGILLQKIEDLASPAVGQ